MAVAAAFPNFSKSDRHWRSSYTTSTLFASSGLHPAPVQGAACSGTLNISSAERRERAIGGHSVLVDQTEHTIQLLGPVGRPGIGQAAQHDVRTRADNRPVLLTAHGPVHTPRPARPELGDQ